MQFYILNMLSRKESTIFGFGVIHILRHHGGGGGVTSLMTTDDKGGGGSWP